MKVEPRSTFSFKCLTCPRSKDYGAAQLQMEIDAGKHTRTHPGHRVELRVQSTYHVFGDENQEILVDALDEFPF